MTVVPTQHAWSSEALFNKALLYAEEMGRFTADDWQYALWSSLSLELIARSALANISPTLLADRKNGWRNVYHALGHDATATGFTPRSVPTSEVLSILNELVRDFTKELQEFCVSHTNRRNAELHSGEEAFVKVGTSEWLPKFYASCDVLLRSQGRTLEDLLEDPTTALEMIASLKDVAAKAVARDVATHKALWVDKNSDERETAQAAAAMWATRHNGHRVLCPACDSPSIIRGSPQGPVSTDYGDDVIVQRQSMLPASFECIACGLKISGYSKLSACGLGNVFTATERFSPAEFFGLHTAEELEAAQEPQWEEDSNE